MMNVLAIGLVLTSLFTAAVWFPSATHHDDHREVIVKEGHRVVVVEYDKEADGSTKVLISPNDVVTSAVDSNEEKPAERSFSGPRELVCDAYGKCKHKIASALGKTKDKVEETVHGVTDKAREIEEHAKEAVKEAIGRTSENGAVPEKVAVAGHTIGESLGKAKDSVAHGIDKAKKVAGDVAGTVKDGAVKAKEFDVVDSPKRIGEDIASNGKVEESMKQTVENVKEVGEKSISEILSKLKDVTYDVICYINDKIGALVGLIHMLGFSTAYGMSVWVTFISSYILGRYLPKQQFGVVQSRIYPVYFKAMAYCVSAALLGHLASGKNGFLTGLFRFPGLSLLSALLMVLTNMIFLEPRATKTMYERMKIEKEEGRGVLGPNQDGNRDRDGWTGPTRDRMTGLINRDTVADHGVATVVRPQANVVVERQDVSRLNEKLRRLNTYSSALNVSTLFALTWHMAHLGTRLHATL